MDLKSAERYNKVQGEGQGCASNLTCEEGRRPATCHVRITQLTSVLSFKRLLKTKATLNNGSNLSQVVGSEFTSRKTSKCGGLQNENFAAERYLARNKIK